MKKDCMPDDSPGLRLREVRSRAGLTQIEMADKLGISTSAYSKIEVGILGLSKNVLLRVCREFGVSSDWMLGGSLDTEDKPARVREGGVCYGEGDELSSLHDAVVLIAGQVGLPEQDVAEAVADLIRRKFAGERTEVADRNGTDEEDGRT